MLCSTLHLPYKEAHAAQLTRMNLPIHEWIYNQFLTQLNKLIASGLRFDYLRVEEESKFIRGQLNVTAQQRQTTERAHLFHIRHDIYHPNRLENRLIKSALGYIQDNCRSPENWRLANELSHILSPVQSLSNPMTFIPKWSNSKTLHNYKSIKPWCELILEKMNPHFQKGSHRGISLLFPMERLFEEHVAVCLKKLVKSPWQLKTQASSKYMIEARDKLSDTDKNRFYLKPDLLINFHNKHHHVMDTKWKLINGANNQKNFDLSQSDIYQLFAYGHKYIGGNGDLMLIYPKHEGFNVPLPYFKLDNDLRLWVIPFCIESDRLVDGSWIEHFLTFKAAAF